MTAGGRMTEAAIQPKAPAAEHIDVALVTLSREFAALGRADLQQRIEAARVRVGRPSTVVCVVGEFKQGKSSLVNGLVGHDICPVDDDIATAALTLVRHGEELTAIVRYRGDADPAAERISIEEVRSFVTDVASDESRPDVDRVDVLAPSPLLADGLAIVDTPGMGGLGAGHASATLSFLPFADGLLFVSDSTSELTAPELQFLERARSLCPNVIMVAPKTDFAPEWRRVIELNEAHLAARDLDIVVMPVSSALRTTAFATRNRELNERSGYPALLQELDARIIAPARSGAADRARSEALALIEATTRSLESEQAALEDPAANDRLQHAATDATARLETLRGSGARWQTVLGDRLADLSSDVNHRFRGAIRETARQLDERIEILKNAEEWDGMARDLQSGVADAVTGVFVEVEDGRAAIRDELADLLSADDVVGPTAQRNIDVLDAGGMWRSRNIEPDETKQGKAFRTGLTGLRGAQGGVMMLGISSGFLPGAAALFMASNPVLLGAGALFGGFQLMEDRKRRVQQRRQAARGQMRQFTDDVQFEMSNELTKMIRDVQRTLRDEFIELIGELQQSWTQAAQQAEQALARGADGTAKRSAAIAHHLAALGSVCQQLESTA